MIKIETDAMNQTNKLPVSYPKSDFTFNGHDLSLDPADSARKKIFKSRGGVGLRMSYPLPYDCAKIERNCLCVFEKIVRFTVSPRQRRPACWLRPNMMILTMTLPKRGKTKREERQAGAK